MSKLEITKKFLVVTLLLRVESTSICSMEPPFEEQAAISLSKLGIRSSLNPITIQSGGIAGIREARRATERLLLDPTEKEKIAKALQAYPGDPVTALNSYNTINEKLAELEKPGGLKTGGGMMQPGNGMGIGGIGTGIGTATGGTTVDIDTLLAEMEEMGVGEVKTLYTETIKKQLKISPDTSSWKRSQFIEAIKELYQPSEKKAIEDAQKKYDIAKTELETVTQKLMSGKGTDKENDLWSIEADKLSLLMEELDKIINAEELKKKEEEEKAEQRKQEEEANALKQKQIEERKLQKAQETLKDKQNFDNIISGLVMLPPLEPNVTTFFTEKDDLEVIKKLKNAKIAATIAAEIGKITDLTVLSALRFRLSYYTENAENFLNKADSKITMAGINNVIRDLGPINLAIENTMDKVSGPKIAIPILSTLPIEPEYEEAYTSFQKFWNSIRADKSNPVFKSLDNIRLRTGTASDAIKCAIEEETILGGKNANLRKVDIEGDTWKEYTPLEVKAIIGSLKKMLPPIQLQDTIYIIKYLKEISEQLEKDNSKMSPKAQARHQAEEDFLSGGILSNPVPRGGPALGGGTMPRGGRLPVGQKKATPVFKAPTRPVTGPWVVVPLTLGSEESGLEQELITQGISAEVANEAGNAILGKTKKLAKLNAALDVLVNRNAIDTTNMVKSIEYRNIINSKLQ